MKLARPHTDRPLISLVPMIDVMLILLVFFMVTSTFFNLDMIPIVERRDPPPAMTADPPQKEDGATLLVRIAADGRMHIRGRALDGSTLQTVVADRLDAAPLLSVVLLPSPRATTQDLVSAMDLLTGAGVTRLRLVQLEASE